LRLILWTSIRPSIGTKNLIPEEVNYTKITIRVPVMNKVQFLLASEPRKPLKPRSLYVIFLVKKDMRVNTCPVQPGLQEGGRNDAALAIAITTKKFSGNKK
jgi:hypothetical protein